MNDSTSPRPLFVFFGASYSDDVYGEDLPVGSVLRLDLAAFERLQRVADQVLDKSLGDVCVPMAGDSFRWLKTIGFTTQNAVSPILGFVEDGDGVLMQECFRDAEIGIDADFLEECEVYHRPMSDVGVKFSLHNGELVVAPVGWVDVGSGCINYGGVYESWDTIRSAALARFEDRSTQTLPAEKPSASLVMSAAEKATILAALEAARRPTEVGGRTALENLIARVQSVQPWPPQVEEVVEQGVPYFESMLQVTIFSEESAAEGMELDRLAEAIYRGDCAGTSVFLGARQIGAETMAQRLLDSGIPLGLFGLDGDDVHQRSNPSRPLIKA